MPIKSPSLQVSSSETFFEALFCGITLGLPNAEAISENVATDIINEYVRL